MKNTTYISIIGSVLAIMVFASFAIPSKTDITEPTDLYTTIVELDRMFVEAYNTCDLETQAKLISEDLEFYHDQGGLTTSKEDLLVALKENICGKVKRELVAGSIEVSEIPGYGAVQIGFHKFYNNQEPDAISNPGRFVTLWKKTNDTWQMTRVISLH